ncbi:hypothetical protein B7463_g6937, partial [Scytalidium lignicola]
MADIDYSILFLGIIASGGIYCGSNPQYTPLESINQLNKTGAKFVFTENEFLDKVLLATKKQGLPSKNIFIFDHGGHKEGAVPYKFESWRSLLSHGEADWVRFNDEQVAKQTTAAYVMSSGTTGLPKAVMVSHYNFVAEQMLAFESEKRTFEVRRLLCLPQFATAAIYSNHICPLRGGEQSYLMRRFNTTAFINNIEKFQITELSLMPPMLIQILHHPLASKEKFRSVQYVHGGGAAIGKELQRRMKALLPPATPFTQIWGMSETSGTALCLFWPEHDDTGSIGRPIPNLRMKLIDDDGKDISAFDTKGELCIKGPTVMVGYLDNPAANESAFDADGWLKTGDICYCDGITKKWYMVDRKKELIKVRAFQVAPPELEEILLSHPDIIDAAVIGVDFPERATELPRAYVVVDPQRATLTEEEVKKYVAERVVKYKWLEGGVIFVEAIPKAASGKILKNVLRERAKKEMERSVSKL